MKTLTLGLWMLLVLPHAAFAAPDKPNVIIVLTDDQGYGDIGAHGHPFLKTPHLDKLHGESVRFTDFHVAPMCSPTRGQLMTGVDAMKNGCTAVNAGRSMVREDIPMLSNYFADAGYATGLFGKWHMGDSYPYRPQDRGFQEVLSLRAWGLPSLASNWENSTLNPKKSFADAYMNPVLEHNGVDVRYPGFSGDIWFTEAMKYMAACREKNQPFFVYLANHLAHVPDSVPEKHSKPYAAIGKWKGSDDKDVKVHAAYYGQIANVDENMGRLDEFLAKHGLKENTIVVYFTDNGSRSTPATEIYNGGMRGHKTEMWEGGHRVPCFLRWPKSEIQHGRDISELTEVQDIAPTLLDLCRISPKNRYPMDGVSWARLLRQEAWPHANRKLVIEYGVSGKRWVDACVLSDKWRLLNGGQSLFNVKNDPHQDADVAAQNAEIFRDLNSYYDNWYQQAHTEFRNVRYIHLGHPSTPEVILYANDWQGDSNDNPGTLALGAGKGKWDVAIESDGEYQVELSRWPFEADKTLFEGTRGRVAAASAVEPTHKSTQGPAGAVNSAKSSDGARPIAKAQLTIAKDKWSLETKPEDKSATFTVRLTAGKTKLTADFLDKDGTLLCNAFYVKVTRLK
jgi:arylsulfatase A-like enzyme